MEKSGVLKLIVFVATMVSVEAVSLADEPVSAAFFRQQLNPFFAAIEKQYETWPAELILNGPPIRRGAERAIELMDTAVNCEAYDLALKYLLKAKWEGVIEVKESETYATLIRKLQAAPNDPANRLVFVEAFWNGRNRSREKECYEARQFLLATDELPLSPEQRLRVYQRIIDRSLERSQYRWIEGEIEIAFSHAERIRTSFPNNTLAAGIAYIRVAGGYRSQQKPEKSREVLEKALLLFPESTEKSRMHLDLSEDFRALKDDEGMLRHLKLAAQTPETPTKRFDDYAAAEAVRQLGIYYQEQKDFRTALEYFTSWKPNSDCGTCLEQMHKEREASIKACEAEIKQAREPKK